MLPHLYYTYSRYIYKMIYIDQNSDRLIIPCNRGKTGTEYSLYLIGMSNVEYEYVLTDSQTSRLYYSFPIDGWDIPVGQYNYRLVDESNTIMASGLLQFGELKYEPEQKIFYNRQIIKIFYDRNKQTEQPDKTIS